MFWRVPACMCVLQRGACCSICCSGSLSLSLHFDVWTILTFWRLPAYIRVLQCVLQYMLQRVFFFICIVMFGIVPACMRACVWMQVLPACLRAWVCWQNEGIYFSSVHVYVKMYTAVIMCCSVLQCVAVCCSVLQCVAVCCSVMLCAHIEQSHVFFSCCNLPSIADGSCHTFEWFVCVSYGTFMWVMGHMNVQKRFPNISLIKQSNTHTQGYVCRGST